MGRLNAENLKKLREILKAAGAGRQEAADDLESVREAVRDCVEYVACVARGENELNWIGTGTEEYRNQAGVYDSVRHAKHDKAIQGAVLLNRLSAWYRKDEVSAEEAAVFLGDEKDRHQVAEFCLEVTAKLFNERRRIL